MCPWRYFIDCERQSERDPDEGTHSWFNPKASSIVIDDHPLTSEGGTISASLRFPDQKTKIFCASTLRPAVDRTPGSIFEDQIKKHGDHLLVIWNVASFLQKLQSEIEALKQRGIIRAYRAGLVEYFDPSSYDGDVGPFRKTKRYAFEREWRLMVQTTTKSDLPFTMQINPVEKQSKIIATDSFVNLIDRKDDGSLQFRI
jgi:hypothetical protein